jgi:hypothetical protein
MAIPGVNPWGSIYRSPLPVKVFAFDKIFLEEWCFVHGKVPSLGIVAKGMELLREHFSHGVKNTPGNVKNVYHDVCFDTKNVQLCKTVAFSF